MQHQLQKKSLLQAGALEQTMALGTDEVKRPGVPPPPNQKLSVVGVNSCVAKQFRKLARS